MEGGGGTSSAGSGTVNPSLASSSSVTGFRQEVTGTTTAKKEVGNGDDVKVKVNSKAKANAVARTEWLDEETGETSLLQEKSGSKVKVEPDPSKEGEESSNGPAMSSEDEVEASETPPNEDEAHPCLFIDNILAVVFKHILDQRRPLRDVQNIRQVCKTWRDSITRLYRASPHATTTFSEYDYRYGVPVPDEFPLTEFVETMRTSDMIPVQKFTFYSNVFLHRGDLRMFREFLILCGPELVTLSINMCTSSGERIIRNLNPDLGMMKLRRLEFRILEDYQGQVEMGAGQVHGIVRFAELLLKAAGSLRELELSYAPCSTPYRARQEVLLQQLSGVIAKGLPSSVKQLKLNVQVDESGFNDLAGIQSKLEWVELNVSSGLGTTILHQFLQNQAASLKHLQIRKLAECRNEIVAEFPRLDELTHLELPDATVSFTPSSNFAGIFPKLECLDIQRMTGLNEFAALISHACKEPLRSLKVLHLPVWRFTTIVPLLKDVAKSFPCLKELHIDLHREHKETMEEVFKYFDSLESLHISFNVALLDFGNELTTNWVDSLFSGIEETDCARIKRMQDFQNENLGQLQRRPSLLHLSKLRKLVIENNGGRGLLTITDFTAHFVFREMVNLREIHLPRLDVKFSPNYRDLLLGRLILDG